MFEVEEILYHTIDFKQNKIKVGIKASNGDWDACIYLSENQVKDLIRELKEELGEMFVQRTS